MAIETQKNPRMLAQLAGSMQIEYAHEPTFRRHEQSVPESPSVVVVILNNSESLGCEIYDGGLTKYLSMPSAPKRALVSQHGYLPWYKSWLDIDDNWMCGHYAPHLSWKNNESVSVEYLRSVYDRSSKSAETVFDAELIKTRGKDSFCWVDLADGMCIQTMLPAKSIAHLGLSNGDKFRWNPETQTAETKQEQPAASPERMQLLLDVAKLTKQFHEELKHQKTTLDSD